MNELRTYFRNIAVAVESIITGLAVTFRHVGRTHTTLQYPEERDELPPRSRMMLFMNSDECIACKQCARACPVNCITIESEKRDKDEEVPVTLVNKSKKSLKLTKYEIDMALCCYCSFCVETCPTHCLYMTPEFEFSVTNTTPEQLTVIEDGEDWTSADNRRVRTQRQTQHPKYGRHGLIFDFIAITKDLHRRGEHVPVNPLYPDEYRVILDGPIPDSDADDPYHNRAKPEKDSKTA